MSLTITTNNVPRPIILGWELTEEERREFDYHNWPAIDKGEDSADFFRYRGQLYDLGEFSSTGGLPKDSLLRAWDGYASDSYFSGIAIRWPREDGQEPDYENIIVGLYIS